MDCKTEISINSDKYDRTLYLHMVDNEVNLKYDFADYINRVTEKKSNSRKTLIIVPTTFTDNLQLLKNNESVIYAHGQYSMTGFPDFLEKEEKQDGFSIFSSGNRIGIKILESKLNNFNKAQDEASALYNFNSVEKFKFRITKGIVENENTTIHMVTSINELEKLLIELETYKIIHCFFPGTAVENKAIFAEIYEPFQKLIQWVKTSGNGYGKLVISSHGEENGQVSMGETKLGATLLAEFLYKIGVNEDLMSLKTLSLNMCYSGHFGGRLSTSSNNIIKDSTMGAFISTFENLGVFGLSITGSNEESYNLRSSFSKHTERNERLFIGDKKLRDRGTGWLRILYLPDTKEHTDWAVNIDQTNETILVECSSNWEFITNSSATPLSRVEAIGQQNPFPIQGWLKSDDGYLSPIGWKLISKTTISFKGTGGYTLVTGAGPSDDRNACIMESITHSGAKLRYTTKKT